MAHEVREISCMCAVCVGPLSISVGRLPLYRARAKLERAMSISGTMLRHTFLEPVHSY
jgi:hypothetical protein